MAIVLVTTRTEYMVILESARSVCCIAGATTISDVLQVM